MTDFSYENEALLPFRVRENTKKIETLEGWRREVDSERATQTEQISTMSDAVVNLNDKVEGLSKILIGFALSIAGSSVVFALTILAATGRIP